MAEVRYDDDCGNGHNSFSITGVIRAIDKRINPRDNGELAGGCLHEEIAKAFPELAPFIKWHLTSSDGPMHYIANTMYHASDRDFHGLAKGEPSRYAYGVRFDGVPITHRLEGSFLGFIRERMGASDWGPAGKHIGDESTFQVVAIDHPPTKDGYKFSAKYTFVGYGEKWHECPFHDKEQAEQMAEAFNSCKVDFRREVVEFSEGKERDLHAARHCAVWPDATDEDLTASGLRERLEARLPALLADFRKDVESLGFIW
jgi:hypothetical protein